MKTPDFWAPGGWWPLLDLRKSRDEFGVLIPTNAAWKLKATVSVEEHPKQRFKSMLQMFRFVRSLGSSVYTATRAAWQGFYGSGSQIVESELISNTVPVNP